MNTQGWRTQRLQAGDDGILSKCCNCRPFVMCCVYTVRPGGRFRTASIRGLPWAPDSIFPRLSREMNTELKTGPSLVAGPDLRRHLHLLAFQVTGTRLRKWIMGGNYMGKESPIQRFPHLQLSSHRGSDVADDREGSARRGKMEKKANLNARDSQPLLLFFTSLYMCTFVLQGSQLKGRSILTLVEHSTILRSTNFIWLSGYHYNSVAPFILNYSHRVRGSFFVLLSLATFISVCIVLNRLRKHFERRLKYLTVVRCLCKRKEMGQWASRLPTLLIFWLANQRSWNRKSRLQVCKSKPDIQQVFYFTDSECF